MTDTGVVVVVVAFTETTGDEHPLEFAVWCSPFQLASQQRGREGAGPSRQSFLYLCSAL